MRQQIEITFDGFDLLVIGRYEEAEPGDYFTPGSPAEFRAETIEAFDPNEDINELIQGCWDTIEQIALRQINNH